MQEIYEDNDGYPDPAHAAEHDTYWELAAVASKIENKLVVAGFGTRLSWRLGKQIGQTHCG